MDLRERVLAACDEGMGAAEAAEAFSVSPAWVRRLKQRRRQTGAVAPRAGRPGPKPSWDGYADRLRAAVRQTPDATLEELRERLALAVALSTLWRACAALGLSVKKKSAGRPSRTGRTCGGGAAPGGPGSRPSTRGG
jgi:transposase